MSARGIVIGTALAAVPILTFVVTEARAVGTCIPNAADPKCTQANQNVVTWTAGALALSILAGVIIHRESSPSQPIVNQRRLAR